MKTLFRLATCTALFLAGVLTSYIYLDMRQVAYHLNISDTRERTVFSQTKDNVTNSGLLFSKRDIDKEQSITFLWIHGWGVNFYSPTYVSIGREICGHGHTMLSANTRMHDLGNILKQDGGKRVRGGGYWGIASDQSLDIESWVDLLTGLGYKNIILVGHSAGWSAAKQYQSATKDKRVIGLALASGTICGNLSPLSPEDSIMLEKAKELVASDLGEELISIPNRSFPSYISAASYLDNQIGESTGIKNFFGTRTENPELLSVNLPVLLFYGSRGDIAGPDDLELVQESSLRWGNRSPKITTAILNGANHMYKDKEAEVARMLIQWAERFRHTRR